MSTSKGAGRAIDRIVPGVGRLTIRTNKMSRGLHAELDRSIVRATEEGHTEQLRLLKSRRIAPIEFIEATRANRLPRLIPSSPLRPLVENWLASSGLRPSSEARYRQSWKFLFASLPTEATISDLSQTWWNRFVQIRLREVSTSTMNRDRAALLAFSNWARDSGHDWPQFNPRRLQEDARQSRALSREEILRVMDACSPEQAAFIWTLFETGARQGEVLNLRAENLLVEQLGLTFSPMPGSKNRGRARTVPISHELTWTLEGIATNSLDGRIFPFSRHQVQRWWKQICQEAGIQGVTLHGVRATFITLALDSGIPVVDVQKLVGHSSVTMTMKYYRNTQQSSDAAGNIRQVLGVDHWLSTK